MRKVYNTKVLKMSHHDIWRAVERLAEVNNLSPSGLAKRAGLDATTFNKSKRILNDGRLRWPSTESIMRILEATGTNWDVFVSLMHDDKPSASFALSKTIPLMQFDASSQGNNFSLSGEPIGNNWEYCSVPDFSSSGVFAIEITGDEFLPYFKESDRIIASSKHEIRRGDRVFIRRNDGSTAIVEIQRMTLKTIECKQLNSPNSITLQNDELAFKARIMWVSQ